MKLSNAEPSQLTKICRATNINSRCKCMMIHAHSRYLCTGTDCAVLCNKIPVLYHQYPVQYKVNHLIWV